MISAARTSSCMDLALACQVQPTSLGCDFLTGMSTTPFPGVVSLIDRTRIYRRSRYETVTSPVMPAQSVKSAQLLGLSPDPTETPHCQKKDAE